MKKKIVFMIINMNVGGTEKALLNMIAEIPKDKYEITILMLEKYGGFLNSIPEEVHLEYVEGYKQIKELLNKPPKAMALKLLRKGNILKSLTLSIVHLTSKLTKNRAIFYNYLLRNIPDFKNEYDVAVAYAGPMDFISYFVIHKIKAKKKIQWIHFDVTKIGFDKGFAAKLYDRFDNIYVVSEEAKKKLISQVPTIKEKTDVLLNIVSPNEIHSKSQKGKGFIDQFNGLRILTVGRLAAEKGQDLAIQVLNRLIKKGHKVKWYCLGEGSYRKEYENLIAAHNLEKEFILLGSDPNPYTYMDQCDIYVQPSRYEGYCITLLEAKFLKKPIVTTDVNGAREQILDGENGLIVDINENEIFNGVDKLIIDNNLRVKFKQNLSKQPYISTREINKFLDVI
ncbi:glycosyltransferase [Jeotgalibacillus soli]|uniref:Group 1 glycosyl transferase n=1 Tax=Jeotgalibacillus soli TaxID=889306 RepID=A0A0C2RGR4_9BACL|nr:glycosyltransferase [Jeotgalibacillus soli]KIL49365.1 group 1 glycosyl transferase [Jeotgalibacillus soli]